MMAIAQVRFERIKQDSEDLGSDDEHMVSRIFFSLTVGGRKYADLYCNVKQTVGADYETGPIEIGPPQGDYRGPWNDDAFRVATERCYRSSFGSQGRAIRIGKAPRNFGSATTP